MAIERFPMIEKIKSDTGNAAIPLFGRRFHPDQTIVEYLVEFLLVCNAPKTINIQNENDLDAVDTKKDIGIFPSIFDESESVTYWPNTRLELKFFTFFATSKLETRYDAHRSEFRSRLDSLEKKYELESSRQNIKEFNKVLQNFFAGFVGISRTRTWATHTFFPANKSLLGCEVMWNHTKALRERNDSWDLTKNCFETTRRNFLARGGQQLYLQLLNVQHHFPDKDCALFKDYYHLRSLKKETLFTSIVDGLELVLSELDPQIGNLVLFIEKYFGEDLDIENDVVYDKGIKCGWIPKNTISESLLFAWELKNICESKLNSIQKLECMQTLCALQVLRTLCFQSARYCDTKKETTEFIGNYTWSISHPKKNDPELKKLSQQNYRQVENMIYSAMRNKLVIDELNYPDQEELNKFLKRGDDSGFRFFRKLGKALEIIVPKSGENAYFTLPRHVLRFLVPALIPPGEKMRLNKFVHRVYQHYGIALHKEDLIKAYEWSYPGLIPKESWSDELWFADELKSAGYLIPLSDSISIVTNPYS
jgi:hypothetical protein